MLAAFGLSRGVFVAHALQQKAGENCDPWPLVDAAFTDPVTVLPKALQVDLPDLAPTWRGLPAERKAFLRLLSRFELAKDQAVGLYEEGARVKRGWAGTDGDILANPYRIFELTRHDPSGVHFVTLDRGVFPDDTVRLLHPLPEPTASTPRWTSAASRRWSSMRWRKPLPPGIRFSLAASPLRPFKVTRCSRPAR